MFDPSIPSDPSVRPLYDTFLSVMPTQKFYFLGCLILLQSFIVAYDFFLF